MNYQSVLYQDSPLVPPVTVEEAFTTMEKVGEGIPPAMAISLTLNESVGKMLDRLSLDLFASRFILEEIKLQMDDYLIYFMGLSVVPNMIFAAYLTHLSGTKNAISQCFPPGPDALLMEFSFYRTTMLPRIYKHVSPDIKDPLVISGQVYSDFRVNPFKNKPWFLSGLEVSEYLFGEYSKVVHNV